MKNSLHILTLYNNLKKSPMEIVQEFSDRFMRVYDSIPDHVKAPPRASSVTLC